MAASNAPRKDDFSRLRDSIRGAYVLVDPEQSSEAFHSFVFKEIPLGKLKLYDIYIDPIVIHRRAEDIMRDSVIDNFLTTFIEGEAVVRQGEQEIRLVPGTLAMIAGGVPYCTEYLKPSRRLVLRIPHQMFHDRVLGRDDYRFHAVLLADSGLVPAVVSLFRALPATAAGLSETEQYTLAECFLELIGAVVRASFKNEPRRERTNRNALMRRIIAYLEGHYAESNLTPDKIAAANGISTRYLHSLFRASSTTVSKWIWERRLKASREDLLDPSMAHLRVSEIAYRRGFNDTAHFSRAFRDRFNISPSQLREKAGLGPIR
jgi:AraC-like DNA-binding protein